MNRSAGLLTFLIVLSGCAASGAPSATSERTNTGPAAHSQPEAPRTSVVPVVSATTTDSSLATTTPMTTTPMTTKTVVAVSPPSSAQAGSTAPSTASPTEPSAVAWARGWSVDQIEAFLGLVQADLNDRYASVELDRVEGFAKVTEQGGQEIVMGFDNLIRAADPDEPTQWKAVISRHFDVVAAARQDGEVSEFDEVSKRLRIRIAEAGSDPFGGQAVSVELVDGLHALLVIDSPQSVSHVTDKNLDTWGKSKDEVFEVAKAATLAELQPFSFSFQEGGYEYVGVDGSFYAAGAVLDPAAVVTDLPQNGVVLAIPTSDIAIMIPVDDLHPDNFMPVAVLVGSAYASEPSPASADLFWWRSGELQRIKLADGQVDLGPELNKIMQQAQTGG